MSCFILIIYRELVKPLVAIRELYPMVVVVVVVLCLLEFGNFFFVFDWNAIYVKSSFPEFNIEVMIVQFIMNDLSSVAGFAMIFCISLVLGVFAKGGLVY